MDTAGLLTVGPAVALVTSIVYYIEKKNKFLLEEETKQKNEHWCDCTVDLNGSFGRSKRIGRHADVDTPVFRLEIVYEESHTGFVTGRGRSPFAVNTVLGAIFFKKGKNQETEKSFQWFGLSGCVYTTWWIIHLARIVLCSWWRPLIQ